jgi:hypothetical protein
MPNTAESTMYRPRPFPAPPDTPAPALLDAERALVALGDLAFACHRQVLVDVLAAWRRYAEASGEAPFPANVTALHWRDWLGTPEDFQWLLIVALATARNTRAWDAARLWAEAREAYARAALLTVRDIGAGVAGQLERYVRDGWKTPIYRMALRYCDEPDETDAPLYHIPVSAIACDLLASSAARAAHLARLVLESEGGAL